MTSDLEHMRLHGRTSDPQGHVARCAYYAQHPSHGGAGQSAVLRAIRAVSSASRVRVRPL